MIPLSAREGGMGGGLTVSESQEKGVSLPRRTVGAASEGNKQSNFADCVSSMVGCNAILVEKEGKSDKKKRRKHREFTQREGGRGESREKLCGKEHLRLQKGKGMPAPIGSTSRDRGTVAEENTRREDLHNARSVQGLIKNGACVTREGKVDTLKGEGGDESKHCGESEGSNPWREKSEGGIPFSGETGGGARVTHANKAMSKGGVSNAAEKKGRRVWKSLVGQREETAQKNRHLLG